MAKKEKNNYINNKDFYAEMTKYKKLPKKRKVISNYIGECILLICNGLAKRPNFSGYTYIDEMVSDGIENCIMAVNSFNPDKSKNAFGYFNKIAWWAFVRRIQSEKKQAYIKHKNVQNYYIQGKLESVAGNILSEKVISDFEEKIKEKKKKQEVSNE